MTRVHSTDDPRSSSIDGCPAATYTVEIGAGEYPTRRRLILCAQGAQPVQERLETAMYDQHDRHRLPQSPGVRRSGRGQK